MFKYPFNGILSVIAIKLLDNYRHLSMQLLKIEAAKSYLQGVQMARLSAIGLMRIGLLMSLICVGALLLHAGLFILLPWTLETKAVSGIILGLIYMVTSGVALRLSMDEKTWMDKSGASEMLKKVTSESPKK